jgi:transcriptional regulator GlxA family with amidase domain
MTTPSHAQAVQRALSLVDELAGEPVSIVELSRAAGVSQRTLRTAFHEVHGLSPKQNLIRHGLQAAHSALQRAHGARGAVTYVATECGFFELGRFASAYRRLFGELPSTTLRDSGSVTGA